jgi:hypothetical protein
MDLCRHFSNAENSAAFFVVSVSISESTVIRLSGRLESEHLDELKRQIEGSRPASLPTLHPRMDGP